jgi:hypothetical protein
MKLTQPNGWSWSGQLGALNGRAGAARHARLILHIADGLTWTEVRAELDCSDSYISR